MKDVVRPLGWMLLGVFIGLHVVLGLYAVYDGGGFGFGFNAPERYAYYRLTGSDFHFTVSGSMKYLLDDVCLQACDECPLKCYAPDALSLECAGRCTLKTKTGSVLASDGDEFPAMMSKGMMYQAAAFRCHNGECGFDVKIGNNQTYSSRLPDQLRAST
jgi:hypothetical protein